MLTANQAAAKLNVTVRQINRLIKKGKLRSIFDGRQNLIPEESIEHLGRNPDRSLIQRVERLEKQVQLLLYLVGHNPTPIKIDKEEHLNILETTLCEMSDFEFMKFMPIFNTAFIAELTRFGDKKVMKYVIRRLIEIGTPPAMAYLVKLQGITTFLSTKNTGTLATHMAHRLDLACRKYILPRHLKVGSEKSKDEGMKDIIG